MHISVLPQEAITALQVTSDEWYVDATLGGGGHTQRILEAGGKVVAFDFDEQAIAKVSAKLDSYVQDGKLILVRENFAHLKNELHKLHIDQISGVLFDFGTSSDQLTDASRGFSFSGEGELDMRMDDRLGVKAKDLLAIGHQHQLEQIMFEYGGEKDGRRIVKAIIKKREMGKPITTNQELSDLVLKVKRIRPDQNWRIHPATKTFQALRIAVNNELDSIEEALPQALEVLKPQGRIVTISFHQGEDRIAKHLFKNWEEQGLGKNLTPKPLSPSEQEIKDNPRSRSAKMRIFEKK
jgi:16S rRNA (cytosine1402-N4)-methyltransferase